MEETDSSNFYHNPSGNIEIMGFKSSYYQPLAKLTTCFAHSFWLRDRFNIIFTAAAAKLLQSCPTLCSPIDGSPPGSPVPGILQARTLEWVAISFSNACKWRVKVKSLSRVWLLVVVVSDPMDCSPPGSSIHGIFQGRILEWGTDICWLINKQG